MTNETTFRIWLEQRQVLIPQLLFQHYKALKLDDEEALIIMHLIAFQTEGNSFPTPQELTLRSTLSTNHISTLLQRLMQKGMLEIVQTKDDSGILYESFSLYPLWERLTSQMQLETFNIVEQAQQNEAGLLFQAFEDEFGRTFSPLEIEKITKWLQEDQFSPELVKEALREAVLASKLNFNYIDAILRNWSSKKLTSIQGVRQEAAQFRQHTMPPAEVELKPLTDDEEPFYNWLEERE